MARNFIRKEAYHDDDKIIFKMHRHPFGLIILYLSTLLGLGLALGLMALLVNDMETITNQQKLAGILILVAIAVIVGITMLIATIIYWASHITLTNEEVRQTIQSGLFSKKSSRLGLANVEDVTVSQNGIFASLFNYGTINIETAGEQANFRFRYTPDPTVCSKLVMDAREKYLEENPNMQQITR